MNVHYHDTYHLYDACDLYLELLSESWIVLRLLGDGDKCIRRISVNLIGLSLAGGDIGAGSEKIIRLL